MNKSLLTSKEVSVHKSRWYSLAARLLVSTAMVAGILGAGIAPANAAVNQQTLSDSAGNSGTITYLGMGKGTMLMPPSSYSTSPMLTITEGETVTLYSQYRVTNNGAVPTSAWSFFSPASITNGVTTPDTIVNTSSPSYANGILPVGASVVFTVRSSALITWEAVNSGTLSFGVQSNSTFCWANSNQNAGDCQGVVTAGGSGTFIATQPTVNVTPTAPTVTASTVCGVGSTITIPTQTGVQYTNSDPTATEGIVTITATPTSGYTFPTGTVRSWKLDLGTIVACDEEVTPLAPTVTSSNECGVISTIVIPTVVGVTYTSSNPTATSGMVTITATTNTGYTFADDAVTTWELDLGEIEACNEIVTPIAPVVVVSYICNVGSTVTIPKITGVTYTNSNPTATEGIITVTASADTGYTFADNSVTTWELNLGEIQECEEKTVTPATPRISLSSQATNGQCYIVEVDKIEGVDYVISDVVNSEGKTIVTATPQDGYLFSTDAVTVWSFNLACEDKVVPPVQSVPNNTATNNTPTNNSGDKLAVTGADDGVLPVIGGATALFLIMGISALLVRRRIASQ